MGARLEGEKIHYLSAEWFVIVQKKMGKPEGPAVPS